MSSRFILPFADVGSGIKPSSGAQLFFFAAGTSTPKDTFSDQLSTPTVNPNPVVADSTGVFGDIFISGTYKVVLKDKNSVQIWEADPVTEYATGSFDVNLINDLSQTYNFATDAEYKAFATAFPVGKVIHLLDRGAKFTVISGTGTGNDANIIASDQVSQSIDILAPYSMYKLGAGAGADDTATAVILNTLTKTIVFDVDKTFELINFVPLSGTTLKAKGSTINRFSDATHNSTGSSASVIIENDDNTIIGGTHGIGSGATKALSFSGSVLIDGGNDFKIKSGIYENSWGGIFGNLTQTAANLSQNVLISNIIIRNCAHNTYLADIKDLTFTASFSYGSDRDGLRTFRNTSNITITDNHIFNNGDGTGGQSRDGIDLFVEGTKCIVTGNHIYDNEVTGMDIKRNDSEPVVTGDKQYIISGNFIHDNGDDGLSIEDNTAAQLGIDDVLVSQNHIYLNGGFGVITKNCNNPKLTNNYIYDNVKTGARVEDCTDILIAQNNVRNNGTGLGGGFRNGLNILNSTGGTVTDNIVRPNNTGGAETSQSEGIISSGSTARIIDNDVTGHATSQINTDSSAKGQTISFPIINDTSLHPLWMMKRQLSLVSASILVNNTITTANISVAKRNLTTGLFSGTVVNNATFVNATVYADKDLGALTSSEVKINADELMTFQISSITSSFTEGVLNIEYCD